MRRKKNNYFELPEDSPKSVSLSIERRCQFSEVDALAIAWHGRYVSFFEEASTELAIKCGLSYKEYYAANIAAPVVQLHVDYHSPLKLNEKFIVKASYIWCEESKLITQFEITAENKLCACTGYIVQLFVDAQTGKTCLFPPSIITNFRDNWLSGKFDE